MLVSPSVLGCDFAHGEQEMHFVQEIAADMVHLDVMDGQFVPNMSFGPVVINAFRPYTTLPFDVHLMMQHPDRLVEAFAKAGADSINIHLECDDPIADTLQHIRALGKKAAIALKPATPAEAALPYLPLVDMVLVMTVEPGFGGQAFMEDQMPKVTALRQVIEQRGLEVRVQVDGGINEKTASIAAAAGADVAVIGSALFNAADPAALVTQVHSL